jgi:hypothetical protein
VFMLIFLFDIIIIIPQVNMSVGGNMKDRSLLIRHDNKTRVTVAARSKACTVFARSKAGILGSNPTQDMDV